LPRILVVIGTRPEAIKLAPVCTALRRDPAFSVEVCLTSQHTDLLAPMLSFFDVRADHDLSLGEPDQTLARLTARIVENVGRLLSRGYDRIIVQGDTTTAFGAALAAFYARIPVAHVEAGLRSGDLAAPFPEEANRRLADVVSDVLFAPTAGARAHLLAEGFDAKRIFVTGNTGIDALKDAVVRVHNKFDAVALKESDRLILVTAHRRESFGEGLSRIWRALTTLADADPSLHILYPLHPNPAVQRAAQTHPRIHTVAPLDYPSFVAALSRADLILTDSGGVQEEAPALGKRVLVLRDTTERPEGVAAGVAELVGTDEARIVSRARALLGETSPTVSPYGDGRAAARIVEVLKTGTLSEPFE
jgi:UDP-N-acetylglucosamine 2-epimerase (non-hydrolysing)